jgi:ribokinase
LEIPFATVEYLARIAQREGIPLILDPAPARSLPSALLKCVDWLTPNETEICSLLERPLLEPALEAFEELANTLLERGARNVVLKLGRRGCYLALSDGTRILLPAYNVHAVDSTAAGDAFNGGLAVALLDGKDPVSSASWASAVAAVSVTRHGAQPSLPTLSEVGCFLEDNQSVPSKR